ncbi:MAG: nickel pincer cofactor biosynthesis protein LarC [Armatimonadota bacterium]|nr:nickel pincer cofactor biosynthesis protein LarC [bacterium]MCS7309802.1 nickel pincer cofactor biosynthesis protein LarC [Armatimonadota bacterium]MDW8104162.1 nickel pincer cofactor biosynthesis protein LarC [Armatimonadota bacterium]MDW8290262.1 nickel pincer cofactor biosynthesis protein LarC [Armatimonadota bacterium]
MRLAYFDCFSGISGDMALGALLGAGAPGEVLHEVWRSLPLQRWSYQLEKTTVNGIEAVDVTIRSEEEQPHRHLSDVLEIIQASSASARAKGWASEVFRRLAQAEAQVHGTTVERVHFHEVGAVDAIADILGVCVLLDALGVDAVECSPLPMSRGFVQAAHGVIPVPPPAVMELLKGVEVVPDDAVQGETVTPTGAALMVTLAQRFGGFPRMRIEQVGYGAGKKRFEARPNLLRVVVGEKVPDLPTQETVLIEVNLDDMNPEWYPAVQGRLFEAGALDVYYTPIQMKRGRPGTQLSVLCEPGREVALLEVLFRETTTFGARFSRWQRLCLERRWETVQTRYGEVRVKVGLWNGKEVTASPEYADCAARAEEHGVSLKEVYEEAIRGYRPVQGE